MCVGARRDEVPIANWRVMQAKAPALPGKKTGVSQVLRNPAKILANVRQVADV
jgi:hypothetical protein